MHCTHQTKQNKKILCSFSFLLYCNLYYVVLINETLIKNNNLSCSLFCFVFLFFVVCVLCLSFSKMSYKKNNIITYIIYLSTKFCFATVTIVVVRSNGSDETRDARHTHITHISDTEFHMFAHYLSFSSISIRLHRQNDFFLCFSLHFRSTYIKSTIAYDSNALNYNNVTQQLETVLSFFNNLR